MQIPQANILNMLNAISNGNHVLNEQATFYKSTKTDCPDCSFDPVRKESTDPNCPTCEGVGYLLTQTSFLIDVSIETEEDFRYSYTNAGRVENGQIFLTLDIKEITGVLNVNPKYNLDLHKEMKKFVNQFDYVLWKGAKYVVHSFEPGWLSGNLYEIAFLMKLAE